MRQDWLADRLRASGDAEAIAGDGWSATYAGLLERSARWAADLEAAGVGAGRVVAFDGDFRDRTVALLLALRGLGAIAVPLASAAAGQRAEFLEIAQAEFLVEGLDRGDGDLVARGDRPGHPLLDGLAAGPPTGPRPLLVGIDRAAQGDGPRHRPASGEVRIAPAPACESSRSCCSTTSAGSTPCSPGWPKGAR